jgi:hypothetical protein
MWEWDHSEPLSFDVARFGRSILIDAGKFKSGNCTAESARHLELSHDESFSPNRAMFLYGGGRRWL